MLYIQVIKADPSSSIRSAIEMLDSKTRPIKLHLFLSTAEAVQAEEPTSTDSSSLRPLARESVDIAAPKARGRKTAAAEKCASCSSFLDSAKKCFERNNGITEAFSKLVKVLSCPHPIQPKLNSQLVDDAMELMVNNLSTRICQTAEPSIRRRGKCGVQKRAAI